MGYGRQNGKISLCSWYVQSFRKPVNFGNLLQVSAELLRVCLPHAEVQKGGFSFWTVSLLGRLWRLELSYLQNPEVCSLCISAAQPWVK